MSGVSLGASVQNFMSVALDVVELLAYNSQKLRWHVTLATPPFRKSNSRIISGLSLGACMPNLKFVSFSHLTHKFLPGHMTLVMPPFTIFWQSRVSRHQGTSFELWTTIIGPHTTSEKCFKSLVENTLCRFQFGVKLGYPYWILTLNEMVLWFQVPDVCAKFHQNRLKTATVRARTDRQTDRQRSRRWSYNLSLATL